MFISYEIREQIPAKLSHEYMLYVFDTGTADFRINHEQYTVNADQIVFLKPMDIFSISFNSDIKGTTIAFLESEIIGRGFEITKQSGVYDGISSVIFNQKISTTQKILQPLGLSEELIISTQIVDIMLLFSGSKFRKIQPDSYSKRVKSILDELKNNLSSINTVKDLCAIMNVSHCYLSTQLGQMYSVSNSYLVGTMKAIAVNELMEHGKGIEEALADLNYASHQTFSTYFIKEFNCRASDRLARIKFNRMRNRYMCTGLSN